jgi:hypothetical protein
MGNQEAFPQNQLLLSQIFPATTIFPSGMPPGMEPDSCQAEKNLSLFITSEFEIRIKELFFPHGLWGGKMGSGSHGGDSLV